jgi:hypothetical protein
MMTHAQHNQGGQHRNPDGFLTPILVSTDLVRPSPGSISARSASTGPFDHGRISAAYTAAESRWSHSASLRSSTFVLA